MANVSNENSSVWNDDYYEYYFTSFNEYKIGVLIWKIVPPILIILGTVGNILSIVVLTRRSIRSSTTALYLTVLAFSDICVLYSGLLRQWLIYLLDTDVRQITEFGCKLNIWLVYSSLDFSAWILIVVTLERVISAWLPHSARTLCTKRSATALLISVGVFILVLNAHLLYGMVFLPSNDENANLESLKCVEMNDAYFHFFTVPWPWVDLCAFCLIPFTVIVIGNSLILFKVVKSQKRVKSRVVPSVQNGSRQPAITSQSSKQSSMTAMLTTLNVVYLISTTPISVYNIGFAYWTKVANEHEYAQLEMLWAIVNMLMYANNSLNFYLYCLSGSKFRHEVIQLFGFCRHRAGAGNTQTATQSNNTQKKLNTQSASPSPKNSALSTASTPLSNTSHHIDINVEQNESAYQNGSKAFGHSNNSLHPNDASNIVVKPGNSVQMGDNQVYSTDTSETVQTGNLDSLGMASSHTDKTENTEVKSDETENGAHVSSDKQYYDLDNSSVKPECSEKEIGKTGVIIVTSQTDYT